MRCWHVCVCVCVSMCVLSHSVVSNSLRPHRLGPTRLLCPWGFSRQEYWSGLPSPPQGNLPNPGTEPRSLHCFLRWRQMLYCLSHKGSPWILGWVACPFSRGSSWSRNRTRVSLLHCRQILYQLSHQGSLCWYIPSHKSKLVSSGLWGFLYICPSYRLFTLGGCMWTYLGPMSSSKKCHTRLQSSEVCSQGAQLPGEFSEQYTVVCLRVFISTFAWPSPEIVQN